MTRLPPLCFLLTAGCVFVRPPPLPEEVEAEARAKAARAASLRSGAASNPDATDGAAEETDGQAAVAGLEPGAEAPVGLDEAGMQQYAVSQGDPARGVFTLEQALAGLPAEGQLVARFETARGVIECELFEDRAPKTVANFVGLARGLRPFRGADGTWSEGAFYDGTIFHRVIPGFMIQGGDPTGTGMGGAGYVIPEEFAADLSHQGRGVLSMANRGPGTGSSQFFITLGPTPDLDGKHTIFGRCAEPGLNIADDIAHVPRDPQDKPLEEERLERVAIERRAPAAPAPQ